MENNNNIILLNEMLIIALQFSLNDKIEIIVVGRNVSARSKAIRINENDRRISEIENSILWNCVRSAPSKHKISLGLSICDPGRSQNKIAIESFIQMDSSFCAAISNFYERDHHFCFANTDPINRPPITTIP